MHTFLIKKIKSHSLQNFLSGVIYQFCVAVSGIILPRLIITHYGSVLNGLISTVTQMVAYLAIVEMGLASASLVALYEPMAKRDYEAASHIVATINKFYHQVAILFSIGTLVGGLLLPIFISDDIPVYTVWMVIAAVSGINLVTYMFLGKYRAILQSDNRLYVSNYVRCIGVALQLLLGILVIRIDWNIAFIKFAAVFTGCIEASLLSAYIRKVFPEIDSDVEPMAGTIKQRKDILVHQISALVLNNTDVLLLTLFGSTLALVSVYSVYNMVMVLLFNVIASFMSARSAAFARLYVLNNIEELRKKVYMFEKWFLIVVFGLYSCMAVLVMPFVRLYTSGVNDANYDLPVVGVLFSILGICRVLRGSYSEIISAAGKFKETRIQAINSTWINMVISLLLISQFQIPGILIGSIIAEAYRTIHCMFYFYNQIFRFPWKTSLVRIIANSILFLIVYIASEGVRNMTYDNYWSVAKIMAIVTVCVMMFVITINFFLEFILNNIDHA